MTHKAIAAGLLQASSTTLIGQHLVRFPPATLPVVPIHTSHHNQSQAHIYLPIYVQGMTVLQAGKPWTACMWSASPPPATLPWCYPFLYKALQPITGPYISPYICPGCVQLRLISWSSLQASSTWTACMHVVSFPTPSHTSVVLPIPVCPTMTHKLVLQASSTGKPWTGCGQLPQSHFTTANHRPIIYTGISLSLHFLLYQGS